MPKILNNLDLNQNEIQNVVLHKLATAPSNPKVGQTYFNTTDNNIYRWNGTAWVTYQAPISTTSISTVSIPNGIVKGDGSTLTAAVAGTDYQAPLVAGTDYQTPLPSQANNSGKYLTTNGTALSWGSVDALPSQTGNSGKFLTTNGTNASWANAPVTSVNGNTGAVTVADENVNQTKVTYSSYTYWRAIPFGTYNASTPIAALSATTATDREYTVDNLRFWPQYGWIRTHVFNPAPTAAGTTNSYNNMTSDSINNIYFRVNATVYNNGDTVMTLYSNGTDMQVRPGGAYNDKVDLGKNTTRWKKLYLTDNVYLGTSDIRFEDNVYGYYKSADGKFYENYSNSTYSNVITGQTGKRYIDKNSTNTYYWNGSAYTLISNDNFYGTKISNPNHTQLNLDGYNTLGTRSDVIIRGVATPTADNDAANKAYVDAASGSLAYSLTFGDSSSPLYSYNGSSAVNVPIYDGDGSNTASTPNSLFIVNLTLDSNDYMYRADKTTANILAAAQAGQPIYLICHDPYTGNSNQVVLSGVANIEYDSNQLEGCNLEWTFISDTGDSDENNNPIILITHKSCIYDQYFDSWFYQERYHRVATLDDSGYEEPGEPDW